MVKVSITLPNNAQITFESEEPEVAQEIAAMVLRDLPRVLMESAPTPNGGADPGLDAEKSTGVVNAKITGASLSQGQPGSNPPGVSPGEGSTALPPLPKAASTPISSTRSRPSRKSATAGRDERQPAPSATAEHAFVAFCHSVSPLGDMRSVVVAAEGAKRFLSMDSVDANDLERLFDLSGWRRPHSFIQTMRNSARSKFRWLERVPGRSGYYTVTDLGRATALGE